MPPLSRLGFSCLIPSFGLLTNKLFCCHELADNVGDFSAKMPPLLYPRGRCIIKLSFVTVVKQLVLPGFGLSSKCCGSPRYALPLWATQTKSFTLRPPTVNVHILSVSLWKIALKPLPCSSCRLLYANNFSTYSGLRKYFASTSCCKMSLINMCRSVGCGIAL